MSLPPTLHATCVAIHGRGVLLTGPPGAGKSDLAFRLIDRGAELVADDRVAVAAEDGRAIAAAPAAIAGLIELRGIGILALPYRFSVRLALVVALDMVPERMPPDPAPPREVAGVCLPLLGLAAREPSAPLKVEQGLLRYGLAA